jgi:hypothetical protein
MPKENVAGDSKRFNESQREIYRLSVKAENSRSKSSDEQPEDSYKKEFFEKLRKILA